MPSLSRTPGRGDISSAGAWPRGYEPVRYERPPYRGRLDVAHHVGRLAARPDRWPDHAPDRADVYQMVTSCERLGLPEATLVYPVEATRPAVTAGTRTVRILGLMPSLAHDSPS